MFRTLIRFLAVCLLALSPLWGVGTAAARPAGYPVWPSFLSTGCNSVSSAFGGTTTVCGQGGFLLTQVNSGYACNRLDIGIFAFSSGPFIVTGTADSGSVENTITVNDTGDYTMDFPGFLVNNLIVIQMSAPDSGSMTVAYIQTIPCPVQPTATNTLTPSNTPTPNPSDTATNTATAGPSHTPTAIPTNTPLPSGHSTFTPTVTPTPRNSPTPTRTATPSGSPTPSGGQTEFNCGEATYPLLDCNFAPSVRDSLVTYSWFETNSTGWNQNTAPAGNDNGIFGQNCPACGAPVIAPNDFLPQVVNYPQHMYADQTVNAPVAGQLWVKANIVNDTGAMHVAFRVNGGTGLEPSCCSSSPTSLNLGHVNAGPTDFQVETYGLAGFASYGDVSMSDVWVVPDTPWTPPPTNTVTTTPTGTPLPSDTATEAARETLTAVASSFTPTPIPIPGQQETPIPSDTPCPGGCAVGQLTQVPGFATRVLVDTSPFSALEHLSLARSSCQPFGYVQLPVPVIHGTPALGSTTPLSFTWTAPVTHTWDDTNVFSNTALQPCAMVNEIPSFVWDLTYWLSVLMCAVGWFMWLIGFVGRLSGDETING